MSAMIRGASFRLITVAAGLMSTSLFAARTADDKDLIDRLVLDPTLKTFTKMVARAGIVEQLKGNGPFTIFAPNDAAFAKLPVGALDALLKDRAQVRKFVLMHVVSGKLMFKDLKEGPLKTIGGDSVMVNLKGGLTVGRAKIVGPDVVSTNGPLHILSAVMVLAAPTGPVKPPR